MELLEDGVVRRWSCWKIKLLEDGVVGRWSCWKIELLEDGVVVVVGLNSIIYFRY